jgi:phthiocerol/phenolphthiocerol synthesis type-I polyketide synthase E
MSPAAGAGAAFVADAREDEDEEIGPDGLDQVAVVGMAGRFPGGGGLEEFWAGLAQGRESLTRFAVDDATGRVTAHGVVPDADGFDNDFFGYPPTEALLLDPQQRVFLECAWEALEHAGHDPRGHGGPVGVYAGCGDTGHIDNLRAHRARFPEVSELQLRLASSADFLTSRIAYKLGLTGPAVTVQTACSTSLVAVHTATQALLAGECDMALAGGVTLHVPFPHEDAGEEDIVAGDGHCRAFDAAASGTVASDGAGIVVLKRLQDALDDSDEVYAVIRGSAVTNDGSAKVGFAAPGVEGQAAAVRAAHLVAGIEPASVGYVEAHGTGTLVGDPIEVRALAKAFGAGTAQAPAAGSVVLGTVKTNIGHTDVAAGVLGLIKVVLSLRNELIPPTLHFRTPNPELGLPGGPFRVSARAGAWPRNGRPRRAGVNSLGLGGTNAHVVVEEAPAEPRQERPAAWDRQILPVSARTPAALEHAVRNLAEHLRARPGAPLADVAHTLQSGRHPFAHRAFVVAGETADVVRALTGEDPGRLTGGQEPVSAEPREAVFLFPGQGGQHVGMAGELYHRHAGFRADIDACAELAAPGLGCDLREVLFPDATDPAAVAAAHERLATMEIGQPAVFGVEYALARLWQSWGVRPSAVVGHSLGAYAAAAIAGVLSLPDAMTLVLARGRLLGSVTSGAMLALPLPAAALAPRLGADLSVAAVNGPGQCVVAGHADAVRALREELAAEGVEGQLLHISTAAHSHLVEPLLADYEKQVAQVRPMPPAITWISDRTGLPVAAGEVMDPAFWSGHLRHTVNFSAALATVLGDGDAALVEVGPGRTLGGLARRHPAYRAARPVVASMPHPADEVTGTEVLLGAAGRLWQSGVTVDWAALHAGTRRRRVALPTYPFERTAFRLDRAPQAAVPQAAVPVPRTAPADPGEWSTRTEAAVAAAFRSILGVERVDGHRSFFELGGDSMLASRVAAVLRRELDLPVGVRTVFKSPTVVALAGAIDEQRAGAR